MAVCLHVSGTALRLSCLCGAATRIRVVLPTPANTVAWRAAVHTWGHRAPNDLVVFVERVPVNDVRGALHAPFISICLFCVGLHAPCVSAGARFAGSRLEALATADAAGQCWHVPANNLWACPCVCGCVLV